MSLSFVTNLGSLYDSTRRYLIRLLRSLAARLETPDEAVVDLAIASGQRMACARIAIDLDIYEHLVKKSPRTVAELAKVTDAEEQLLSRLLRALAAMKWIREVGLAKFAASPITYFMTKPNVRAGYIHWYDQGLPTIANMPFYFRDNSYRTPSTPTYGPLQHAFDTSLESYTYWSTIPGVYSNFNTFMQGHFSGKRLDWLSWFPLEKVVSEGFDETQSEYLFVDVGGGRGHQAQAVRTRCKDVKGKVVLEDLPGVIGDAGEIDGDIVKVKQDFFEKNQIQGARCYYLAHILHNWPNPSCVTILSKLRGAMIPGYSRLLICDLILPDTGVSQREAALDWGMLTLHSGMQRSKRQWTQLVEEAGLTVVKFWTPPGEGDGIVECVRDE
ncbi:MAG: hypothetical protein M1820_006651 [Bogoriella megaspora]|nr:MAG: hypothetical protein M1820_006651 [Bogoriella megaspora]